MTGSTAKCYTSYTVHVVFLNFQWRRHKDTETQREGKRDRERERETERGEETQRDTERDRDTETQREGKRHCVLHTRTTHASTAAHSRGSGSAMCYMPLTMADQLETAVEGLHFGREMETQEKDEEEKEEKKWVQSWPKMSKPVSLSNLLHKIAVHMHIQ